MNKIVLFALCLSGFAVLAAQEPAGGVIDDSEGEPFGPPVFSDDMLVSLWNDSVPVCYQHRDTIPETEYGRCVNFNQLEFEPDGEHGVVMTWHASATFGNGFIGDCTYIYRGTRDVNMISLKTRKFSDDVNDEDVETLDPSAQAVTVDLFSRNQLRFNNRTFDRMIHLPGQGWVREDAAK